MRSFSAIPMPSTRNTNFFPQQKLISINRKNKPILSVRLDTKILAVSNHLLHLIDDSGALFDRLIPLQFTRRIEVPDKQFPLKVKNGELPGIVLLALKGWKRLRENGQFTLPDSSRAVLNELREKGSPVLTFVEEQCQLDPVAFTPTDALFRAWKVFCTERELPPGTVEQLVDALRSACPELRRDRRTTGKEKQRGFVGIKVVDKVDKLDSQSATCAAPIVTNWRGTLFDMQGMAQ